MRATSLSRRAILRGLAAPALLSATALGPRSVSAQQPIPPPRPVKMIVPFPPGGSFDGVIRIVLQHIGEQKGWPSVVENRPGADGQIGIVAAKSAPPDGGTLVAMTSITHGSAPALKLNLGYDPVSDLAPIALLAQAALVLLVRSELPVRTLPEFIALLRERPGKLNYASGGPSSQHFFATAMMFQRAGLPLDAAAHVPFPGIAPALNALLAGSVEFMFGSTGGTEQHIAQGTIRALGCTILERSPRLPNLPTFAEQGFPGFQITPWVALAAPAGTPRAIVEEWSRAANEALKAPTVRERIAALDYDIRGGTPAELAAFSAADMAQYRKLVEDLKLPRR